MEVEKLQIVLEAGIDAHNLSDRKCWAIYREGYYYDACGRGATGAVGRSG